MVSNPFTLPVFELVQDTVLKDLHSIPKHQEFGGESARSLKDGFLDFAGARIELVGVINRMDRQFNRDEVPGRGGRLKCGEISALYRFGYEGNLPSSAMGEHQYKSRLPVTMNVVFPAIPWSGELTCREVAQRWLDYARGLQQGADPDQLRQQARLIVSSLKPDDIDRIELNMQGSRVSAGNDKTDFGTLGTYIIRVFRWAPDPAGGRWQPTYLTNQIDRARLLGGDGDENTCEENRGSRIDRRDLVAWLLSMEPPGQGPNAIGDVDNGLLNIPQPFLACRAISISPGGASRSGNQPFWNAALSSEQIISDQEIATALRRYKQRFPDSLGFIGTVEEFRTRLNDASCSGCHQTRAIAGFHFPGADRPGGSPVNAVYLPGSPHFFGDQLRRMEILAAIANGDTPDFRALAMSYAARPFNRFEALKPDPAAPPDRTHAAGRRMGRHLPDGAGRRRGAQMGMRRRPGLPAGVQIGQRAEDRDLLEPVRQGAERRCAAVRHGGLDALRQGQYRRDKPAIPAGSGRPRDTTIDTDGLIPAAPVRQQLRRRAPGILRGHRRTGRASPVKATSSTRAASGTSKPEAFPGERCGCPNAWACRPRRHAGCWHPAASIHA